MELKALNCIFGKFKTIKTIKALNIRKKRGEIASINLSGLWWGLFPYKWFNSGPWCEWVWGLAVDFGDWYKSEYCVASDGDAYQKVYFDWELGYAIAIGKRD